MAMKTYISKPATFANERKRDLTKNDDDVIISSTEIREIEFPRVRPFMASDLTRFI